MRALYIVVGTVSMVGALPSMLLGFSLAKHMDTLYIIPVPSVLCMLLVGICYHLAGVTR